MTISKVALVTGAAAGIGAACSKRLARDGIAVGVLDLDEERCSGTVAAIDADGGRALALGADVSDRGQVQAAVAKLRAAFGPVTIVVNNAGVTDFTPFEEITEELFDFIYKVNVLGPIIVTQEALPDMKAAQWGRVVNISSSSAQTGAKKMAVYSSSKGAVISLTRTLAQELGPDGITVNTIPPGSVMGTIMADASVSEANVERLVATMPVRRVGRPEDIANACAFLCSEESSYVTGQIIGVNGGRVVTLQTGDADDGVLLPRQRVRRAGPSAPGARVNYPGRQDLSGVKEASELRGRMVVHRCHGRGVAVEALVRALGVDMDRGEHQQASRRKRGRVPGYQVARCIGGEEVQQEPHDQADRSRQVDPGLDALQDRRHLAHITGDDGHPGSALGNPGVQVAEDDRVIVDVGDPGVRDDLAGRFKRAGHRRHPAAKVEELADALARRPGHGAHEELAVLPRDDRDQRSHLDHPVRQGAVRRKVVLAAEEVVIDPRDAGDAWVEFRHAAILGRQPGLRRLSAAYASVGHHFDVASLHTR